MAQRQEEIAEYIREHIRRAREEKGVSQEELGQVIGKTNVTISDIERGKVGVSSIDLALIAKALRRPLNYFFPPRVIVRVPPEELTTAETRLVDSFRRLSYAQLEDLVLDLVERLADFAEKGELERLVDEVVELTRRVRGKD
jgi:transcriptional regulator with XRE-family HTH domain